MVGFHRGFHIVAQPRSYVQCNIYATAVGPCYRWFDGSSLKLTMRAKLFIVLHFFIWITKNFYFTMIHNPVIFQHSFDFRSTVFVPLRIKINRSNFRHSGSRPKNPFAKLIQEVNGYRICGFLDVNGCSIFLGSVLASVHLSPSSVVKQNGR